MGRNLIRLLTIAAAAALLALAACSSSGGDAAITGRVRRVLQTDRVVDASKILVSTERGVVTLDGSVPGEDAHRKAVILATSVEGVRQVRDRLTVTPAPPLPAEAAPPASPREASEASRLGGVLAERRVIRREPAPRSDDGYGLRAAVVGPQGDVTLEPTAEPAVESAARAELPASEPKPVLAAAVSSPRGDEAVSISVPESPLPLQSADGEDAAITARVRESLAEIAGRVQVITRGGVVVLSGAVDTEYEKTRALRLASETKGVSRVEDRIVVLQS